MLLLPLALGAAIVVHGRQPPTARRAAPDTTLPAVPIPPYTAPDTAQIAARCRAQATARVSAVDRMPRLVPDTAGVRGTMPRAVPDLSQYRAWRAPGPPLVVVLPDGRRVPCPPG